MSATPVLPPGWKRPSGWSHGVRHGQLLSIAGQFGWDPATFQFLAKDFAGQWAQALDNVAVVAHCAGGEASDVTALRVYVTSMESYRGAGADLGAGWQHAFGSHFPAITLFEVNALTQREAVVEIEATAWIGD